MSEERPQPTKPKGASSSRKPEKFRGRIRKKQGLHFPWWVYVILLVVIALLAIGSFLLVVFHIW